MGCVSDKVTVLTGARTGQNTYLIKHRVFPFTQSEKAMMMDIWRMLKMHVANVGIMMFTR